MRTLGNLLWLLLGGVYMGLGWWLAGLLMYVSIVGIPFGRSCFEIGTFAFLPFGREAVRRDELTGGGDVGTSPLGTLGNVLWFLLCGWWLALGHLATAAALIVTIIGIPFGIQHVKIAALTLTPIGRTVVREEVADAARR
jgi:Predicted membrane protein